MNILLALTDQINDIIKYFFGSFDAMAKVLLYIVIIDYITGLMLSILNHKLNSTVGFKGIFKKIVIFFMVGLSVKLDTLLNTGQLRYIVITFYIVNEGISVIENVSQIGLPIPKKITEVFDDLKDDNK